jgi:hypothetical protein
MPVSKLPFEKDGIYQGNYGKKYEGSYVPQPGGPVAKIDPRKFGAATGKLFESVLTPEGEVATPGQWSSGNVWGNLARQQQTMQQGIARDTGRSTLAPGLAGFRANVGGIPERSIAELGARADIGQTMQRQHRADLGSVGRLEEIAYALAQKKKAGEELSKKYAEEASNQEREAGKSWWQRL